MASKLIGIVGATGTGKSTSIKHLDPKSTYIINTAKKELPFKGAEKLYNPENKNYKEVDEIVEITRLIKTISEKAPHIKNIVIEDSNYMMAFRMADKANEVGYTKFTVMAKDIFPIQYDLLSLTYQRPYEELYDLHSDPYELRNLVEEPRYNIHLERLRTKLNNWMRKTRDPGKDLRNVPRRSD